jgi:cytochrome d ubiquinol oxidase subunit II
MEPSTLALFWAAVIAGSILIYVILDGFDLGVGILFGTTHDEDHREDMVTSIAPFWDGNETWLVVVGASLFAAFPAVYAVFLGAFYLPVLLMLVGLIFRGVAFEFRGRAGSMRAFWDRGFFLGSLAVAFVQGAAVGGMMRGIPVKDGQYAGGSFSWLHPFPILTGVGLVLGYALLGAVWLVLKNDGPLRDWAQAIIPRLLIAITVTLGFAFVIALTIDLTGELERGAHQISDWVIVLPFVSAGALLAVWLAVRSGHDHLPFVLTVLSFIAAFGTLAAMMWPYMIPYSLTVADAAAPASSLRFFTYGGVIVLPIIAIYTVGVYWIFRGKIANR